MNRVSIGISTGREKVETEIEQFLQRNGLPIQIATYRCPGDVMPLTVQKCNNLTFYLKNSWRDVVLAVGRQPPYKEDGDDVVRGIRMQPPYNFGILEADNFESATSGKDAPIAAAKVKVVDKIGWSYESQIQGKLPGEEIDATLVVIAPLGRPELTGQRFWRAIRENALAEAEKAKLREGRKVLEQKCDALWKTQAPWSAKLKVNKEYQSMARSLASTQYI